LLLASWLQPTASKQRLFIF